MTMNHRMLLGLQARTEGRPDTLPVLAVIAQVGWAVAGVAVAGLFLTERRRRYWLVLPLAATLPALLMAHDVQAGLAAFLAVGITVLGFLVFGRSWWGPLLLVAAGVLLTLLLAANAYVVLGFVFTLLVVGALVVILVGNARTRRRTAWSQARLGHESITTTIDTYGHLLPAGDELISRIIDTALTGGTIRPVSPP